MGVVSTFFSWQVKVSRSIDRALFGDMAIDGNTAFCEILKLRNIRGALLADVGEGKCPFSPPDEAGVRGLSVTGIDLDQSELSRTPSGSNARCIVSPIGKIRGDEDHDVVIAQSVMGHVYDGRQAAEGISSLLKPGGMVFTFCPCRRAIFARLNLILPEVIKRGILFFVFPDKRERQGFPAFYDGCTPGEMTANMQAAGIDTVEIRYFFVSSYFMFFVPLYLLWRLSTFPFMKLWPHRYCETFMFVGEKRRSVV